MHLVRRAQNGRSCNCSIPPAPCYEVKECGVTVVEAGVQR